MENASNPPACTSTPSPYALARKRQNEAANVAYLRKFARSRANNTGAGEPTKSETVGEAQIQHDQLDDRTSNSQSLSPIYNYQDPNKILEIQHGPSNASPLPSLQHQQLELQQRLNQQQQQQSLANMQYLNSVSAHPAWPQMQRQQANVQFVSSLSPAPAQPQSANVQFVYSSSGTSSQQRAHPPMRGGNSPILHGQMNQRQSPLQEQQGMQQACAAQHNTGVLSPLPSKDTVLRDATHSSTADFEIYRGHEQTAVTASSAQLLEASSTSVSFDPPGYRKRKAGDSETEHRAIPLTVKRNMHFANVAFLRQLSRRKQQANLKPPSEKSDLPLPFSRRSFIESSNQREPQGIREDSLGSLHSQGHVDYDEAYSNSRLANVYYFHSLQKEQYVPIPPLAMNRAQIQRKLPTTFVHPSLFNPKSSIRLLHMDSSPDPDTSNDIYCSLKSAEPWINDMKYVCLSYCWGVPTDGKQIFVRSGDGNYQPMDVTDNLYNALQGLRASPISVLYWIDAICIDQTNVTERGEQVGLMRDIYNKAAGVVVWLGPSTERLTAAVRIISNISERFQDDTYTTPDSILSPLGLNLTEEDTAHLQSYTEFSYEEIAHFFSLPWFRRVWVLQEAFSQGNITVRLGPHTLPWGSVILAALWQAQFTRSHTATSTTEVGELGNHHFLPELWLGLLHTRMPRGLSMMELTSRARDFEATDPRDKVFALLGLANDIGPLETRPSGLVPDYAKHKIEVYADFARSIILKTRKLEVLSMVNGFSPQNEMQDFFSWMPNLDASVATIRGLGFPEKYDASCSKEVDVDITGSTNDVANSLRLLGFHIDEAQMVTDQALSFSRDLKLYLDVDSTDAVTELWRSYCAPHANGISQKHRLRQYIELLTAAGFALPTGLSAQPLGKVVPSRHVPSVVADFAAYWARLDPEFGDFDEANRSELREHAKHGDADQFGVLTGKACHERKFVLTSSGRMGLCPRETGAGDNIVILYGGSVPYVLRAMPSGDWKFIGECYIDGIMFGEARDLQETEEVFSII